MLQVHRITKTFPGVRALSDVSIDFAPGKIHALVGENGAGKSTLIKIIGGIYSPDSGKIILDGMTLHLRSSKDALVHHINLVSQEIQVIPRSTVAENIMLDKLDRYQRRGHIDWTRLKRDAAEYAQMVNLTVPVTQTVADLSVAHKQLIMIARALSANARVLIMDEPTSTLTPHESDNLLTLLRRLKNNGVIVIFVSHKLEEVLAIADTVSVLRDGVLIGTQPATGLTRGQIIHMMIGRDVRALELTPLPVNATDVVLEARNICQRGRFHNISFTLRRGEILGFYGMVGSGRTELAHILIGEQRMDSGHVLIHGKPARIRTMADSLFTYRMGYISENRKEQGLILSASIKTNIAITIWHNLRDRLGSIRPAAETAIAREFMQNLDIHALDPDQSVSLLSGGNQQKVSIAKWLAAQCNILIIDEPTIGVDIGAKEYIHRLIWRLAAHEGKSIILISSDLPEITALARRILVFRNFRIVGEICNNGENNAPVRGYDDISQEIAHLLT
ncbi:sugar ABC transporter ATP-binding protein [Roseiflexus sp.]|uniref:sugar ABC transporter ATP-binding protein n=1 Tax=Roseiflexus sp. TaxID=2562120 RepID=UPI0021DD89C1|nr:sugar ABC transporter ATP-binding protein [Roseiflexus sp.]GIW01125.1 MAG: ABC transporter permease [Roseiflexus sp.]